MNNTIHRIVIWGCGHRGKNLLRVIGKDHVTGFIDEGVGKDTESFEGIKVFSYEEYKNKYTDYPIVFSPLYAGESLNRIKKERFIFDLHDCPPELVGHGWIKYKGLDFKSLPFIKNEMIVYGGTFYSVLVYEWLINNGFEKIRLCLPLCFSDNERYAFRKLFGDIDYSDDINENNEVLITQYDSFSLSNKKNKKWIDIYDWSERITSYKNTKLEAFKTIHKNTRRCFIVATGPSLRIDDLDTLYRNNEICFSFNSIVHIFSKTSWRPKYYLVCDGAALDKDYWKINEVESDNVFISDSSMLFPYESISEKVNVFHAVMGNYYLTNDIISDDFSKEAVYRASVTEIAIQLAIYMGFKQIFLLGVDNNYISGRNNHMMDVGRSVCSIETDEFSKQMNRYSILGYKTIANSIKNKNIDIYNATRGGMLEVFPRVDFDKLIFE